MAADLGIDQFLDLGAGSPSAPAVHEERPGAVVVHGDDDPVVLAHDRSLLSVEPASPPRWATSPIRRRC